MDIKYNVSKIKGSKEEIVKDAVSVEEPLEMRLKYKKNGKIETQNISITMRTPGNDEDLIILSAKFRGNKGEKKKIKEDPTVLI